MHAGDAETIIAQYTQDVALATLAPPLRRTGDDARDVPGLTSWFAGFGGSVDFEITELTVVAGEDVAYAHGLNRLTATPQGTPYAFTLWSRATYGLRKIDGQWYIEHEHTSTPFYMETTDGTFKAATDLVP